jgi:hypothetical protein
MTEGPAPMLDCRPRSGGEEILRSRKLLRWFRIRVALPQEINAPGVERGNHL